MFYKKREDDDEFLVIGTDGLFDVLSNDDVCAIVRSGNDLINDRIASSLVTSAVNGLYDNFCLLILSF